MPADPIQSQSFLNAVEVALLAAEATDGLFYDPTILAQLELAGHNRSFEKSARAAEPSLAAPPAPSPLPLSRRPFSFRSIQLDRIKSAIYKPIGLRLDLEGMGKGWTVDRARTPYRGLALF